MYPYHDVWPEVVYCLFTRTIMFTACYNGHCGVLSVRKKEEKKDKKGEEEEEKEKEKEKDGNA